MTITTSSDTKTLLLGELSALLRLTTTEAAIARTRTGQARRDDIRRELADNARMADERAALIQSAIRNLGAAPDVFAGPVGVVSAFAKATFEQAQPFTEALLGDLALEHQLLDRAKFTRILAAEAGNTEVADLMDRLETAHTATIDWLLIRLAEVAQGGPAALSPTPTQAAVSTATRFALLPARQSGVLVNRTADLLARLRGSVESTVSTVVERTGDTVTAARDRVAGTAKAAKDTVETTAEVVTESLEAGRDAALARAEEVTPDPEVKSAIHETRETLGAVTAEELPIKSYDALSGDSIARKVGQMDDAEELRVVRAYELANKARRGVIGSVDKRLEELAAQAVAATS